VRALFLLLLLANVLFYAWSAWVVPDVTPGERKTMPAAPLRTIRLVSESPIAEATAVAAIRSQAPSPGADCVSAGPYLDAEHANLAAERLASRGFSSRLRQARDEVWVGQWVRIVGLASRDDADRALATMRAAGLPDATVLTDEPPGNVVSLGVFTDTARAGEAATLAREAGFAASVGDRYRTAEVYWLDIDRLANAGLPEADDLQDKDSPSPTRLELRVCAKSPAA
jgi:hypothetical protein